VLPMLLLTTIESRSDGSRSMLRKRFASSASCEIRLPARVRQRCEPGRYGRSLITLITIDAFGRPRPYRCVAIAARGPHLSQSAEKSARPGWRQIGVLREDVLRSDIRPRPK
jgi:hypothetical protein